MNIQVAQNRNAKRNCDCPRKKVPKVGQQIFELAPYFVYIYFIFGCTLSLRLRLFYALLSQIYCQFPFCLKYNTNISNYVFFSGAEREAELNVMQCVFTGLPRVGKSSFWKRLQGIIPDRLLPSTDITSSEGSVRLDVRGSCGFAVHVSEIGWKKIQAEEEMDGFLSLVTQQGSFPEHLQPQKPLEGRNLTLVQDSPGKKLGTETSDSNDVEIVKERSGLPISMDSSQMKVTFQEDGKEKHPKTDVALELQYKTTAKMEKTKDIQTVDLQLPSPSTVLEQALIKMRLAQVSVRIDSASFVFCTDTGGQPEYQELLSLLMAASNTVFIIFNLMHDLQSIQPLEYLPSVNEDPVQYESPHTVGEMLCQSLISVPIHNLPGEESLVRRHRADQATKMQKRKL